MVWSVDMCGFVSVVPKKKKKSLYNIRPTISGIIKNILRSQTEYAGTYIANSSLMCPQNKENQ